MKKILETQRLILREYTEADFDALYAILSDPETMQHYPKPYDQRGTVRWLEWSLDNYQKQTDEYITSAIEEKRIYIDNTFYETGNIADFFVLKSIILNPQYEQRRNLSSHRYQ